MAILLELYKLVLHLLVASSATLFGELEPGDRTHEGHSKDHQSG